MIGLTVFMLVATLGSGWYLLGNIDALKQQNAALARFLVLLLLALFASVFLFGVLRSAGRLTGQIIGANVEFGGPAALFVLIMLLGMGIITPVDPKTVTFALQPGKDESMEAVSEKVTALVDIGSYNERLTFNATGMTSLPSVPQDILSAKKIAVRIQSSDYRIPGNDQGQVYLPFRSDNRVDIPLERIEQKPAPALPTYAQCRAPSNGIETASVQQSITKTSPWMGGGYDPTKWCNDVTSSLRGGPYPTADFRVVDTSEDKKSTCEPFNCPVYKYTCLVEVITKPTYKLGRAPECGPA